MYDLVSPKSDINPALAAALRYAKAGLRVIPIPHRAKGPTMPGWQRIASADPDLLASFFPGGAQNLGLVLGNGVVALDVDAKSHGLETLQALEAEHGSLPRTPTQMTGGGGRHYLFRIQPLGDVKITNRTGFLPGLDLKADAGQIVAEPSEHPSGGRYEWLPGLAPGEVEIAELPDWLLPHILKREAKAGNARGTKEGGRNSALTREAGRLRARGAEEAEIRAALIVLNSSFEPPLVAREVETIVASILRYPAGALAYTANDHGLATRFIDELGDDLRFVADENVWLVWNGSIWERDETGRVIQLFLEMARAMLLEAEGIPAADDDKKALKAKAGAIAWARQAGENKRVNSALKVAQTDPRVVVTLSQLDNFPGFLPVANGIVQLATGALLPSAKEKLATRASPFAYKPEAPCPRWRAVIARALPGDLAPFFQRVLGYSLMGNPCAQRFFVLRGEGADSKSTVARVAAGLLGPLLIRPAGETFLASDNEVTSNAPRADLMAFRGARVVFAPEPDSRRKLDKELIKRLTGQDGIQARAPYGRTMVEFEMTGVVLMLANHLPGCDEADEAAWRRLTLIPFDHTVPEAERDDMLVERLLADEAEGILAWLIEGARTYAHDGLQVPEIVRRRTAAWRRAVGKIERFVDENCTREGSASLRDLHLDYRSACMSEQHYPLGLDKFGARLKQLGFTIEVAQAGENVVGLRRR
ncbi:phage/plasmid primase, P4 family [Methylorubrum rhodesianum]|uniref:phage/plasmid primase, P4 family n=1 Tax=Methylorubrum rhodesianum TaxID=29427 RepID=UPI003CFF4245